MPISFWWSAAQKKCSSFNSPEGSFFFFGRLWDDWIFFKERRKKYLLGNGERRKNCRGKRELVIIAEAR